MNIDYTQLGGRPNVPLILEEIAPVSVHLWVKLSVQNVILRISRR